MPTMIPYPISGESPVPERMISETFRWITNTSVKEWVVFHSFEVSDTRISFVLHHKTDLCVICLEVVLEPTDLVDLSGNTIAPISISKEVMEKLRKQFPEYFDDDSPLAIGHAVVYPTETQYEAKELPEHLRPLFPEGTVLPRRFTMVTEYNATCDPLNPSKLGEMLENYAFALLKWENIDTYDEDWENAQLKFSELQDKLESKHNMEPTLMKIFSTNLDTLNRELLRLTYEQYTSLDRTEKNPRCIIDGAAGTGKTVLAMELAKRRAEKHEETVALMCSNATLSGRFEKWATGISKGVTGKIVAGTPATLLLSVFKDNDVLKNKYTEILKDSKLEETLRKGDIDNGWYHFIGNAVDDLRENEFSNYFDYLIVDEAQNLLDPCFLNLMNELLKDNMDNGCWTMFGDLNQAIVMLDRKLEWEKVLIEFGIDHKWSYDELKTNCRNTHEIADAVYGLTNIPSSSMSGVHGPDVQIKYFEGQDQLENQLEKLLSIWKSEGHGSRQIILLSSTDGTEFGTNQSNYGGWKLCNIRRIPEVDQGDILESDDPSDILKYNSDVPSNILRYSDVYDFQGLESDLVILVISRTDAQVSFEGTVLIENEKHLNRVLYIGMSRAKTMLIVLADKNYKEHLNECIETWKMDKTRSQNNASIF